MISLVSFAQIQRGRVLNEAGAKFNEGLAFMEAKKNLKHGEWIRWIRDVQGVSQPTAWRRMRYVTAVRWHSRNSRGETRKNAENIVFTAHVLRNPDEIRKFALAVKSGLAKTRPRS
jgi:hypothetical protein